MSKLLGSNCLLAVGTPKIHALNCEGVWLSDICGKITADKLKLHNVSYYIPPRLGIGIMLIVKTAYIILYIIWANI